MTKQFFTCCILLFSIPCLAKNSYCSTVSALLKNALNLHKKHQEIKNEILNLDDFVMINAPENTLGKNDEREFDQQKKPEHQLKADHLSREKKRRKKRTMGEFESSIKKIKKEFEQKMNAIKEEQEKKKLKTMYGGFFNEDNE